MMKAKISNSVINRTTPEAKDVYVWDQEIAGYGLKVTPKGKKVLIFQYRMNGRKGKTRRITIGTFGRPISFQGMDTTLTADRARKIAQIHSGKAASGIDPQSDHDKRKTALTLRETGELFLESHLPSLKPRTQIEYRRVFDAYLDKNHLDMMIDGMKKHDIENIRNSLKINPYGANRTIRVLSRMFNWAIDGGFRTNEANPCLRVKKFSEKKVTRYLSAEEYSRLGVALRVSGQSSLANVYQIAAIRLLCLTGARKSEILTLKWSYVNFSEKRLYLPDSKEDSKSKIINLNDDAVNVLSNIPKIEGNPYIMCGLKEGAHIVNIQKPWSRIRAEANLDDVRLHDLRHSFASVGINNGHTLPVIGKLLGHKSATTTARYAHLAENVAKDANQKVGGRVSKSMESNL